ncbi:uncharacterized protein [Chelonus insularis]|uniref:uncharacterized protein n=1 Tax=Chelonus insularis TaxID=460826 RepID=UPI00158F118F|nr:uncharacterized protein LOC118064921 [Chelonus insularis]XP_034935755.1 uncharacterized protein LOC118064921 [Chelonus insularis]XP_034935757.1 uncharacterized protein LOC118064921 [Chelonus insularis]
MYLRNVKCFISIIITILMTNYVKSTCIESKSVCTCIRSDGKGYDLSPLKHESPIFSALNNFVFQPCKNIDLTFKGSVKSDCKSSSVCMNNKTESVNLGTIEESEWELSNDNDVYLVFKHGKYITKINLVYCHNCSSTLIVQNSSLSTYKLVLVSPKCGLVMLRPRGLSTGSVLVILFLVFSSLYFIGGAMALKFFRGAVGWELIPNYDFWSDLPVLVRDGVTFTLSGCTAVSYERI